MGAEGGAVVRQNEERDGVGDRVDLDIVMIPFLPLGAIPVIHMAEDEHGVLIANGLVFREEALQGRVEIGADIIAGVELLLGQKRRKTHPKPALGGKLYIHRDVVLHDLLHLPKGHGSVRVHREHSCLKRCALSIFRQPQGDRVGLIHAAGIGKLTDDLGVGCHMSDVLLSTVQNLQECVE